MIPRRQSVLEKAPCFGRSNAYPPQFPWKEMIKLKGINVCLVAWYIIMDTIDGRRM
jgi:hypothetical protein